MPMRPSIKRDSAGSEAGAPLTAHRFGVQALHLLALWSFAVAQPLFDLLSAEPAFFVVRGSPPVDVRLLAVFLVALAPLPLLLLLGISALVGRRTQRLVHHILVAVLVAVIFLPPFHRWLAESSLTPVVLAAGLGAVASWSYSRFANLRTYLTWLCAAILILPVVFISSRGIRRVAFPNPVSGELANASDSEVSLVLVVLDELPLVSLLDEHGFIDAIRYPNLAALAGESTWYANATSVADFTLHSVPALLSGNYPVRGFLPVVQDYPNNLFTLLAGSHELQILETFTRLCPASLCPEQQSDFSTRFGSLLSDLSIIYLHSVLPKPLAEGLPSIDQNWQGTNWLDPHSRDVQANADQRWRADRAKRFRDFADGIKAYERPSFVFLHTSLPHAPWIYLPSGLRFPNPGEPAWKKRGFWTTDEAIANEAYRRHLLQAEFVDTLVGELVQRLRDAHLYEESVVVVTSDHGFSFRPGGKRRELNSSNRHDILPVPLIVKSPFQSEGVVDLRSFELVDLLPTIASQMGLEVPWEMAGRNVHAPATVRRRPTVAFATFRGAWKRIVSKPRVFKRRGLSLSRKLALFGSGSESLLPRPPKDYSRLIDLEVDSVDVSGASEIRLELPLPASALDLDPDLRVAPIRLSGTVSSSGGLQGAFHLAVAVNGVIRGVTKVGTDEEPGDGAFWAFLLDEESFKPGSNVVDFFAVERRNTTFRLKRISAAFSG